MKEACKLLLIIYFFQVLWPDGTFFMKLGTAQSNDDDTEPNQKPSQTTTRFGGSKISTLGAFEQQLEAARRASEVKKMLFGEKCSFKSSILYQVVKFTFILCWYLHFTFSHLRFDAVKVVTPCLCIRIGMCYQILSIHMSLG